MKEQEWVVGQLFDGNSDDVSSASEPCMGVPHLTFGLEAPLPQPLVREGEAGATMVILSIFDPHRSPIEEDGAVLRHAVWNASEDFCQMQSRVGVVADPQEEHLPVQFIYMPYGAPENVRWNGEWAGDYLGGARAGRRKGEWVVASHYP